MSDDQPSSAFSFVLRFDVAPGPGDVAFQEVSGIGPEMETESIREGGENRFVHALPKGVKHQKLILKRGVAPVGSPIVRWCREVLEGGLDQPIATRRITVSLIGPDN